MLMTALNQRDNQARACLTTKHALIIASFYGKLGIHFV